MYPWSKFWRTRLVINSTFVYHFVDPDLRIETLFKKDETTENRGVDFEIGDIGTSAHLYWRSKKISCRACLFSYCFLVPKKYLLKALLTCTFIPPLLSSESRKKYTLRLLLTCLEAQEEGFFCFPGRGWERDSNLFSLVKLYEMNWIWTLDQNLVMTLLIVAVCTVLF